MRRTEAHREDGGELLGFAERAGDRGRRALTVLGGELATSGDRDDAVAEVEARGLAALAETWWFRAGDDDP